MLLDGAVVTSAALLANKLAPGARRWFIAGHRSPEPAHPIALDALGLTPLLDLGMRLGEGSGAVAALPLVKTAVDLMIDMSTMNDAGVEAPGADESDDGASAADVPADPTV